MTDAALARRVVCDAALRRMMGEAARRHAESFLQHCGPDRAHFGKGNATKATYIIADRFKSDPMNLPPADGHPG